MVSKKKKKKKKLINESEASSNRKDVYKVYEKGIDQSKAIVD
jgi:hypothetical protein